jgi:hypothetical protein
MHPAILAIALGTHLVVQGSLVVPVSDHIPSFHVERTCKALNEVGVGVKEDQAYNDCLTDEKLAQQQLVPIWSSYSASIRAHCTSETTGLGMNSYLDLIYCLQVTDSASPHPGAGVKRTTGKSSPN